MRYLLDTHTFAWAVQEPERLSVSVRATLSRPSSELVVSAVTPWEMATKARLGKWPNAEPLIDGFRSLAKRLRAETIEMSVEDGIGAGRLDWTHRDPFDRMLVAQALARGLTIITVDRAITAHPVPTLW